MYKKKYTGNARYIFLLVNFQGVAYFILLITTSSIKRDCLLTS